MMRIYPSPSALAETIGMGDYDGFLDGEDWINRAGGLGAPAEEGWVVTFVSSQHEFTESGPGYVVAYEILPAPAVGERVCHGRAVLLTGRISGAEDEALLARVKAEPWFGGHKGETDIEVLADWLDRQPEAAAAPVPGD